MNRAAMPTLLLLFAATAPAAAADLPSRAPGAVQAGAYTIEPRHTRVQFAVSHLGITDWYGDFTGASGSLKLDPADLAASKLEVTVPVASVSTTNATLDGELKSAAWFDAALFPAIRFVSTKIEPTAPDRANVTGDLTFHGVTRPVVLTATLNGAGADPMGKGYLVGFNAIGVIKRSDFGVKTYLPMIGDETSLRISAAFEKPR